jgi:phosphoribosylformylglycinamidine (FGAM) synthase-like enzyme
MDEMTTSDPEKLRAQAREYRVLAITLGGITMREAMDGAAAALETLADTLQRDRVALQSG